MSANDPAPRARLQGFSLVELLVVLVFTGILMAGLTRVFTASTSAFATTMESAAIQRDARWALNLLQDDFLQAGFLLPPRVVSDVVAAGQDPLIIRTSANPLVQVKTDGTEETLGRPDELEVVMDVPLGVQATLVSGNAGDGSISISFTQGADLVQAGDLIFVQDSAWELFKVGSITGGTVTLAGASELLNKFGDDSGNAMVSPKVMSTHRAGAELHFIRPLQVVGYTVQLLNLDPGNSEALTPCLVRRTKPLGGAWGAPTLVMEGVSRFNLDWSLDGGRTWIRQANGLTASAWEDVKDATQTAYTAAAGTSPLAASLPGGLTSPVDPFWFKYVSVLMKVDVETRTRLRRTEYANAPNTSDYRVRRETMMLSSRNFTLGAP